MATMKSYTGSSDGVVPEGNEVMTFVQGVVVKGGKVLMIHQEQKWVFPGGEHDGGESAEEVCVREVYADTGVQASIVMPLMQDQSTSTYLCTSSGGELQGTAQWVSPADPSYFDESTRPVMQTLISTLFSKKK